MVNHYLSRDYAKLILKKLFVNPVLDYRVQHTCDWYIHSSLRDTENTTEVMMGHAGYSRFFGSGPASRICPSKDTNGI